MIPALIACTGLAAVPIAYLATPASATGPKPSPTLTISFNPASPVTDGTPVTITGNAYDTTNNVAVTDGMLQIQQCNAPDRSLITTTCTSLYSDTPDASGNVSLVTFDTTGYSNPSYVDGNGFSGPTLYFFAHYVPAVGAAYGEGWSPVESLTVNSGSTCDGTGLFIGNVAASGNGAPSPGETGSWSFTIQVQNCTGVDLTSLKVQGGTVGWATSATATVSQGSSAFKGTKKNPDQVLVWTAGALANNASATVTVTITGTVPKGSCGALPISGSWSATGSDANGTAYPSTYTDSSTITVVC